MEPAVYEGFDLPLTDRVEGCPRPGSYMRRMNGERGAALVEFALVFVLFMFLLYGLIAFGMILALKQSITSAAADGARAAVGAVPVAGETLDQAEIRVAKAKVDGALGWLGGKYQSSSDLSVAPPTFCTGASGPKCISVTITYPYETRPLVPPAPGLGLVTPSSIRTTAVVQVTS